MANTITLRALDGANPLAMLAALGAFRIATLADDSATMHWEDHGGWRPVLTTQRTEEQFVGDVLAELHRLAGAKAREEVAADLRKRRDKAGRQKEKLDKELAKSGRRAPSADEMEELRRALEALENEAVSLDQVLADLGREPARPGVSLILNHDLVTVPAEEFRRHASPPLQEILPATLPADSDLYTALGCDGIVEEKDKKGVVVVPTPFCFSHGGSGKVFLKDFRNCAAATTRSGLCELLKDRLRRKDEVTGLLWDPRDQQSYARRWSDPGNSKKSPTRGNAAANALAFLGLTFCVALPIGTRLTAVGMDSRARNWTWPLWAEPLTEPEVRAVMAMGEVQPAEELDTAKLRCRGIVAVRSCRRFFLNKRPFFSPSRAL